MSYLQITTNPPYMGASNMNPKLNDFIKENYADYKSDFFSAFVVHCSEMATATGKLGFFTPYVWMFIQSYEKMRQLLCQQKTIETLIQYEYSAFEEATVPVCAFAFGNGHVNKKGCYFRLTYFRGGMEVQRQKTLEAINNHACGYYYEQSTDNFAKIPGMPVAYWASANALSSFSKGILDNFAMTKTGMQTGDNNKYSRLWFEVQNHTMCCHEADEMTTINNDVIKWIPYNKGGDYRKWYGNQTFLVNWAKTKRLYQNSLR